MVLLLGQGDNFVRREEEDKGEEEGKGEEKIKEKGEWNGSVMK